MNPWMRAMHFNSIIKLIRRLEKGLITIKDLPFEDLNETELVRIMKYHGWQYQALPKRVKTPKVLEAAVLSKCGGVKFVGHENVTDDLACKAIDKFGLTAFQLLNDRNKSEHVCIHAVLNNPMAFRDIKQAQRTQAVSELAFSLNNHLITNIGTEHLTEAMLRQCITKKIGNVTWPAELFTPEIADLIAQHYPDMSKQIPDHLMTPQLIAKLVMRDPGQLGHWSNIPACVKAVRFSVDNLHKASEVTRAWALSMDSLADEECLPLLRGDELEKAEPYVRSALYAKLYLLNVDILEEAIKLAPANEIIPDAVAAFHGPQVAIQHFPKARNRGHWLQQELGL